MREDYSPKERATDADTERVPLPELQKKPYHSTLRYMNSDGIIRIDLFP